MGVTELAGHHRIGGIGGDRDEAVAELLTPTQAQTVIAAAILRHLHAVITTGQVWDPLTATHGTRQNPAELAA